MSQLAWDHQKPCQEATTKITLQKPVQGQLSNHTVRPARSHFQRT